MLTFGALPLDHCRTNFHLWSTTHKITFQQRGKDVSDASTAVYFEEEITSDISRLDNLVREASFELGLTYCLEFINKHPGRGEGFFYAGVLNYQMGLFGQSMEMLSKAHALDPDVREYALALSGLYAKSDELNDALYFAKVGAANEPNVILDAALTEDLRDFIASTLNADPKKHYVQAMISYNMHDFPKAVAECEQELKLNSRFVPAYALIGKSLIKCGSYERALMAFQAVLDLNHEHPKDRQNEDEIAVFQAECYLHLGCPDEALNAISGLLKKDNITVEILSAVTGLLVFVGDDEWAEVRDFCRTWTKRLLAGKDRYFPLDPRKSDRIRIGILTDKAFECHEGRALEVFAKQYDRRIFDCFLYVQNVVDDPLKHGFSGLMTGGRDVFDIDDKTLALIIKRDEIDVLIDMCGFGENQRLNLIAHQPARAQVSWLVSPVIEGQPGIDRLWHQDTTMEAFEGVPIAIGSLQGYGNVTDLPAHENEGVTFGARLDLSYITPEIAAMWGLLISNVEGSHLKLGLVDDVSQIVMDRLNTLFEPTGILDRMSLDAPAGDRPVKGAFFEGIDILLGQPTTNAAADFIDGLWSGVPCLSIPPDRNVSYSGRDIVAASADAVWNAGDALEFVKQGGVLASDLDGLAQLRSNLRSRVAASSLFDGVAFADQLQGRLIEVVNWSREHDGETK